MKILFCILMTALNTHAFSGELPAWVKNTKLYDDKYHYIICSHDGLDPEDVKQVAEAKCLTSAAKLGGVTVELKVKTVQSLEGADSSEVAEIIPFKRKVYCEWSDRYLEVVKNGFRVWLKCRSLKEFSMKELPSIEHTQPYNNSEVNETPNVSKYRKGSFLITSIPQADKVLIISKAGERVIGIKENSQKIEISNDDEQIIVRKHRFKDYKIDIRKWNHGDSLAKTVYLEEEF